MATAVCVNMSHPRWIRCRWLELSSRSSQALEHKARELVPTESPIHAPTSWPSLKTINVGMFRIRYFSRTARFWSTSSLTTFAWKRLLSANSSTSGAVCSTDKDLPESGMAVGADHKYSDACMSISPVREPICEKTRLGGYPFNPGTTAVVDLPEFGTGVQNSRSVHRARLGCQRISVGLRCSHRANSRQQ